MSAPQSPAPRPEGALSPAWDFPLVIQETHLDVFGHVNNAVYLELFEEARWEIITTRGFGLETIREKQIGPVILEATIKFQRELTNREPVVIRTWCSRHSGKITTLTQVMINAKGEEACRAEFTCGLFDLKARRLISPTPEWLHALGLGE
jgi:acyl-CoA thioester hydrolase